MFNTFTTDDLIGASRTVVDRIQRSAELPIAMSELLQINAELLRRIDRMQTIVYEMADELDTYDGMIEAR